MNVAAILINYNDKDNTLRLAKELERQQAFSKVVVVDNNSTNVNEYEELKCVANDKILVIQTDKNGGYNYALNQGILYLESLNVNIDIYMCSNTDIDIPEDSAKACISAFEHKSDCAVVAPIMLNSQGEQIRRDCWKHRTFKRDFIHSTRFLELLFWKTLREGEYSKEDYQKTYLPVDCISGACFFIDKTTIKDIGYFDTNVFLFYEEDILYHLIKDLGKQAYCLTFVNFTHFESQSIGKTINYYRKMKNLFKSKLYYHKTYNNIKKWQEIVFYIQWFFRCFELAFEIPARKLLKK